MITMIESKKHYAVILRPLLIIAPIWFDLPKFKIERLHNFFLPFYANAVKLHTILL